MKIKDMTDDELRALILDTLHPRQPAQSQPRTPRLVEAVEQLFRDGFDYYGDQDARPLRLALAAEKKRSELVEKVIAQTRCFVNFGGVHCGLAGVKIAINNLDAYEKGAVNETV